MEGTEGYIFGLGLGYDSDARERNVGFMGTKTVHGDWAFLFDLTLPARWQAARSQGTEDGGPSAEV